MNVRRLATLAAATGLLVSGLSAAAGATVAPPKEKCDPPSKMRVTHSDSGRDKVKARGCVEITQREDGSWQVTGVVHAKAYVRNSKDWRLVEHRYEQSCQINTKRGVGGSYLKTANNRAGVSEDGATDNRCLRTTLSPGTYVFKWTYNRQADNSGSAVNNQGEVTFTIPGSGLPPDLIVRPMPHIA